MNDLIERQAAIKAYRWNGGGNPYEHYECDQCGEYVPHKTNYCPNCGARMQEVEE